MNDLFQKSRFLALAFSLRRSHWLVLTLFLAFGLSMIGANWGRVECWNPDQMALRSIPRNLMMHDYLKPPLDTYVHKVFAIAPFEAVMKGLLHHQGSTWLQERLLSCRILTTLIFCLALVLAYLCCLGFCGKEAAGGIALLMGTSAGLLEFNHYATADSPLHFWMIASFFCGLMAATTGRLSYAIAAGLLAGLSTADKYNGLGVGVALPAAFFLSNGIRGLLQRNLWIAVFMVPVGFVIGCPGVIFENKRFIQDFLYNLYTTPVYSGDVSGPGYFRFLGCFPDLIGWPCSIFMALCCMFTILMIISRRLAEKEQLMAVTSIAVLFFYFLTIGRFPRMESRFVLPAVPFVFFVAAPALQCFARKRVPFACIITPLIIYNIVCSFVMDMRYLNDPRMESVIWAKQNFKSGDVIESSYSPSWDLIVDGTKVINMPHATGRAERFKNLLGSHREIMNSVDNHDPDVSANLYTGLSLKDRNPDFVTFSSQAIEFTEPVSVKEYYKDHLKQALGYQKVFERKADPVNRFFYPRQLDFVADWIVILKRNPMISL